MCIIFAGQENSSNGRSRSRTRTKGASPLSPFNPAAAAAAASSHEENAAEDAAKKSMVGRVESIRQFLLHGSTKASVNQANTTTTSDQDTTTPQCNCRHHPHPQAPPPQPGPPPFLPAYGPPPPNLMHRRSKSQERLNARMSLATTPAPMMTPTTAALIGPFIFYQPQEVSR